MAEQAEEQVLELPKNFGYHWQDNVVEEEQIPKKEPEVKEEVKPEVKEEVVPEVKEEPPVEIKPEIKPAEVTKADWKQALKAENKYEVLKELGYDDWTIDMLKYKEQTGDLTRYLEAKTVDYTKMTPEQLIKVDLQRQNPGMSEKALNFKFNKELSEKYYLNREDYPEDSDEAIYGQEQLRLDGEQKRKAFIEEQNKFKAPEPQPDLNATKRDAELQQQRVQLTEAVMNNDATKTLQTTKSLVFGEGEESFKYPIKDIQPLVDTALSAVLASGQKDLTGVDMNVFYKQLAIGQDLPGFEKAFAKHQYAVARKKLESEMHNQTPVSGEVPALEENLTPAQQLARYGKFT